MRLILFSVFFLIISVSTTSCVTTVRATPNHVTVVKRLPTVHKVVYVKGHKYYHFNGNHYRKTRRGYVVVRI